VTLHFAYGSNMSRALMRVHAPDAQPLGRAQLSGYRFIITGSGYASVVRASGKVVHGVLWRLTARDLASLNVYECIDAGLYRRTVLPVAHGRGREAALVYLARDSREGRPRPGYLDLVVEAAREWQLPDDYIRSLRRWSPVRRSALRPGLPGARP
jgi:gamma-glutamylcyclotransferase (GGCT)/AIG2-like uncharacterized protein YtfP